MGGRWVVSTESVEQIVRLRASLVELDREGNPTPEEIREIEERRPRRLEKPSVAPAP